MSDEPRPDREPDRRSRFLARFFAAGSHQPSSARRRRSRGVFVGWLVLMTVWGFGRAGLPDHADLFLLAGLAGGALTAYLVGRAPDGRRHGGGSDAASG